MEWKLHLRKNELDNEYSKALAYLQIGVIGLITLFISTGIFFLQNGSLFSVLATGIGGVLMILMTLQLFEGKLESISSEIRNLK